MKLEYFLDKLALIIRKIAIVGTALLVIGLSSIAFLIPH